MVKAVVGANWGDEGKGKITDMLAKEADIVIRFQGGANAGHTIVNDYGKFALHTLPSGVFYSHITNIIGNGVALDIPKVFNEVNQLVERGVPAPHLMISDRAQVVMPYHILQDTYEELPENCRKYIEFIENQIGYPITMVSNGPGRDDIIYRNSPLA